MSRFENLSSTQKLRAALHRDVRAISTETCHFLGLEISKTAMEIVAELVFKKLLVYGPDLEAFAKHAKRTTINAEDVKLLVRRNNSLKSHLNALAPISTAVKEKRRKTLPAKQTETPVSKFKESDDVTTKEPHGNPSHKEPENLILKELWEAPKGIVDNAGSQKNLGLGGNKEDEESMVLNDTIDLTFD